MDTSEAPVKETKKQKEAARVGFNKKQELIKTKSKPKPKLKEKKSMKASVDSALKESKEAVDALEVVQKKMEEK